MGGEGQWRPKHPLQCLKDDTCLGSIAHEQKQGTMARFCQSGMPVTLTLLKIGE